MKNNVFQINLLMYYAHEENKMYYEKYIRTNYDGYDNINYLLSSNILYLKEVN